MVKTLIFLSAWLSPLCASAAEIRCESPSLTESGAVAQLLKEARDAAEIADPERHRIIFHDDVNLDGIPDLFVTFECGNHSCRFTLFLGLKEGRYCRLKGTLHLTAGEAKRIVKVLPQEGSDDIDLLVFVGAAGVDSGSLARYRLEDQVIYPVCEVHYNFGPTSG
jgi:hypothetical protein